jgi:AcrR family transcriptional regulator
MSETLVKSVPPAVKRKTRSRDRFELKREKILVAATELINQHGLKGMTLLDIARAVGLNTTSVTYYFKRKELLAAAVFEQTLQRLDAMVREAGEAESPEQRVSDLVAATIALRARIVRGTDLPMAKLSEIRTLDEEYRKPLELHYQDIFRTVRAYFGEIRDPAHKALLTARAHLLLEVVFWLPMWIGQYALSDFPRVHASLVDILLGGLAPPDVPWAPVMVDADGPDHEAEADGPEGFLRVATRLINDAGYRGASVVRIADQVNVTKGSFYHHLDGKDDLVIECFRRSFARISRTIALAQDECRQGCECLESAIATLLNIQFYDDWPLMRTTALQSLPAELRADVVARSNRTALQFMGIMIDGMRDGSLRIVDPLIASQFIIASINTAYDLQKWASRLESETAIAYYGSAMLRGLCDDRVANDARG